MSTGFEVLECPDLPAHTVVAPEELAEELKHSLPDMAVQVWSSEDEKVYLSSDLCDRFVRWTAAGC